MAGVVGDQDRKPWLLCLNLQREYVTRGRPLYAPAAAAAATCARTCIARARENGWTVVHVQTNVSGRAKKGEFARPIDGLEPLPSEPLFRVAERSAFANEGLLSRLVAERPPEIYMVGFAFAHEGLASLFEAASMHLPLHVVEDAVASPAIGDRNASEVDRVALAIAASLSSIVSSGSALRETFDALITRGSLS